MNETINLTDIILSLWKKKKIIIGVTIIFALVVFLKVGVIGKVKSNTEIIERVEEIEYCYAQTTFTIEESNIKNENQQIITNNMRSDISDMHIATYSEMIKSQRSLANIKNALNLDSSLDKLYNSISVSRVSNSNVIRIVVANTDETKALQIAKELLNEFIKNMINSYPNDRILIVDEAYVLSDEAIADIYKTNIIFARGDIVALGNILVNTDITKILPIQYIKTLFEEYIFISDEINYSQNINVVEELINKLMPQNGVEEVTIENQDSPLKQVIIAGLVGFILSACCIIVVDFLSNTINSERHVDTKLLGVISNKNNCDIYDILKIKLEQNKSIAITSAENFEQVTDVINGLVKSFQKCDKKVIVLSATDISNLSSAQINNDYVIVNAKNVLNDANSLLAIKTVKDTILLVTERKTKVDTYNMIKETLKDIDANLLGSILIK